MLHELNVWTVVEMVKCLVALVRFFKSNGNGSFWVFQGRDCMGVRNVFFTVYPQHDTAEDNTQSVRFASRSDICHNGFGGRGLHITFFETSAQLRLNIRWRFRFLDVF